MQSYQPGAKHSQNCGDDSGLQEDTPPPPPPPALPPLTIMGSSVTPVESFRFLRTTISQDLKWDNHIDSIVKKAQQRLYFPCHLWKFNNFYCNTIVIHNYCLFSSFLVFCITLIICCLHYVCTFCTVSS